MTTISHNRRRRFPLRTVLGSGVFIVVLIGVFFLRAPLAGLLWRVLTPVLMTRNSAGALVSAAVAGTVTSNATLQKENEELRAELASTSAIMQGYDLLVSENNELKKQLGRVDAGATVVAAIVARPPGVPYDTLIVDAGSNNRVTKGAVVSVGGTTAIGYIEEVYSTTARVVLYSAPGQTRDVLIVPALDTTRTATPASILGQGAGSFFAEVPANSDISVGDLVIMPGISEKLLGRVSAVVTSTDSSFNKIYVQLPTNIFAARFVNILVSAPHEK